LKTTGKLGINMKRKKNCVILGQNTIFGVDIQDIVSLIQKEAGKSNEASKVSYSKNIKGKIVDITPTLTSSKRSGSFHDFE